MSGNLFRPDLFSRSTPAFETVSGDCYAEIASVISTHYSNLGHELKSAMKLSGLEINSQNYKVKIGPHFYALKRVGREVSPSECNGKLVISQRLLELEFFSPASRGTIMVSTIPPILMVTFGSWRILWKVNISPGTGTTSAV